jgi:hypothetical protein
MNRYTPSVLLGSLLLAGSLNADVTSFLDLPESGTYEVGTVVTTSVTILGATFDISYTIGATASGDNVFVSSTGTQLGVGSDTDISSHYNTLEGNDGEGISFTDLTVSNFVANDSGLTESDIIDSLTFSGITFGATGNSNDGVDISFTDFDTDTVNKNLSSFSSGSTLSLSTLSNYDSNVTDLYLIVDSAQSNNRWSVAGIQVSYVPEPSSYALLAGLFGLGAVMLRRRQA